ncbi:tRNA lysidine(34) synthetase TilS [bacterium]|nr:tRNA lysidine(34) synthetase TilS [bacterium]
MKQEGAQYGLREGDLKRVLLPEHVSLQTGVLYAWWVKQHRAAVDEKLLLAVSGGCDSMALLYLCLPPDGERDHVVIGHVHHGTGDFADQAAELLASECRKLKLPQLTQHVSITEERRKQSGFEAAAREVRYAALERMATEANASVLFTAHTADDLAEGFLLNAMRGASISGLSGARVARKRWIRPLLNRTREELRGFAERAGIPFLDDPSNVDERFTRVAVRHQLGPMIREQFGDGAWRNLARTALHLQQADSALEMEAARIHLQVLRRRTPGWASIDARRLVGYLDELVFRVLRCSLADVLNVGPGEVYLDRNERGWLLNLARTRKAGTSRVIAGVTITVRDDLELSVYDESTRIRMNLPGHVVLPDGSEVHVELETVNPGAVSRVQGSERPGFVERLDADAVGLEAVVQPWQRGDTFHPLGSRQDSVRVVRRLRRPAHERTGPLWVMRTEGGEIAWVLGERIAEPFRVTEKSRRILVFRYDPPALKPEG